MTDAAAPKDVPLITVGITCFNAADTIERALKSALVQDWPNKEIIIVDDVSTDTSVELIQRAIAGAPNTRLIQHRTNVGPAGARNTILNAAAGDFIAFFDDDDESWPNRLSAQVALIEAHERSTGANLIACYTSGVRHYDSGYEMPLEAIGSRGEIPPHGPDVAAYLLYFHRNPDWFYGGGTPACSLMARLSTFKTVGGFDDALRRVEDADFAIRLALAGGHFIGTRDQLFTQHSTSAADKSPEKNLEAEQDLAKKHETYLRSQGRFYYAYHWPLLRYWHFKGRPARLILQALALALRYPIAATRHLLTSARTRAAHERKIRAGAPDSNRQATQ